MAESGLETLNKKNSPVLIQHVPTKPSIYKMQLGRVLQKEEIDQSLKLGKRHLDAVGSCRDWRLALRDDHLNPPPQFGVCVVKFLRETLAVDGDNARNVQAFIHTVSVQDLEVRTHQQASASTDSGNIHPHLLRCYFQSGLNQFCVIHARPLGGK